MRSNEGEGEWIALFNLGDEKLQDDVAKPFFNWAILKTTGEDYSETRWPITIKVKRHVTNLQLKQALTEVVIALEEEDLKARVYDQEMDSEAKKLFKVFGSEKN